MSSADRILAIETSTNVCSVCYQDSDGSIHEKKTTGQGIHSELLFTSTDELMSEHEFEVGDLNAVLVSAGPGSYTGLRIAASGVKGMLFGWDVNLIAIDTLASFAVSAYRQNTDRKRIHAVIDARRNHLYYRLFEVSNGDLKSMTKTKIEDLDKINIAINSGDTVIGTGLERLDSRTKEQSDLLGLEHITACSLIQLYNDYPDSEWSKKVESEDFEPLYLSNQQVNNSMLKGS